MAKKKYPKVTADLAKIDTKMAKELLGWNDEFEGRPLITDRNGVGVVFDNNSSNRPFRMSNCKKVISELLRKKWRLNGETIIISDVGEVISGQHRLAAVVLAEQDRKKDKDW